MVLLTVKSQYNNINQEEMDYYYYYYYYLENTKGILASIFLRCRENRWILDVSKAFRPIRSGWEEEIIFHFQFNQQIGCPNGNLIVHLQLINHVSCKNCKTYEVVNEIKQAKNILSTCKMKQRNKKKIRWICNISS